MGHQPASFVRAEPADLGHSSLAGSRLAVEVAATKQVQDHLRRRQLRVDPNQSDDFDPTAGFFLHLAPKGIEEVLAVLDLTPGHLPASTRHAHEEAALIIRHEARHREHMARRAHCAILRVLALNGLQA
jgi:hypothetical protein